MVSAVVYRGNGGPWEWRTPGMADPNHYQRLKCTKFDFGWGSAQHPAGGAHSAPPDP